MPSRETSAIVAGQPVCWVVNPQPEPSSRLPDPPVCAPPQFDGLLSPSFKRNSEPWANQGPVIATPPGFVLPVATLPATVAWVIVTVPASDTMPPTRVPRLS